MKTHAGQHSGRGVLKAEKAARAAVSRCASLSSDGRGGRKGCRRTSFVRGAARACDDSVYDDDVSHHHDGIPALRRPKFLVSPPDSLAVIARRQGSVVFRISIQVPT